MFIAGTGAARAQDEGVKQIEQLIKSAKTQVEAIRAGAAASLKSDADKLNGQAKDLYAAIDRVTDTASANIAKLSAE